MEELGYDSWGTYEYTWIEWEIWDIELVAYYDSWVSLIGNIWEHDDNPLELRIAYFQTKPPHTHIYIYIYIHYI